MSRGGFVPFCTKYAWLSLFHVKFYVISHFSILFRPISLPPLPGKVIKPRLLGHTTMQKIVVFFSIYLFLFHIFLVYPHVTFSTTFKARHNGPMFTRADSLGVCWRNRSPSCKSCSVRLAQGTPTSPSSPHPPYPPTAPKFF